MNSSPTQDTRSDADSSIDHDAAVTELSPSAKLIYKVLEYEGPLTQEALVVESRLCSRTVRYGLRKLEDEGVVDSRVSLDDARQSVYRIDD